MWTSTTIACALLIAAWIGRRPLMDWWSGHSEPVREVTAPDGGFYLTRVDMPALELRSRPLNGAQGHSVVQPRSGEPTPADEMREAAQRLDERWQTWPGSILMLRADTPREGVAVIDTPAKSLDPYDDPDLRKLYGPGELRRREVRLADEAAVLAGREREAQWQVRRDAEIAHDVEVPPATQLPAIPNDTLGMGTLAKPEHIGADETWADELHAIVTDPDKRGQLLPEGMPDPVIEEFYASLTDDEMDAARYAAEWRALDNRLERIRRECTANLVGMHPDMDRLFREMDDRDRRNEELAELELAWLVEHSGERATV